MEKEILVALSNIMMPADDRRRLESQPRGNSLANSDMKEMVDIYLNAEENATRLVRMLKNAEADVDLAKKLAILIAMLAFFGVGNAKADPGDLHKALKSLEKNETFKVTKNSYNSGKGEYSIEIGPYLLKGNYFNTGSVAKHTFKQLVDKNANKEELQRYKPIRDTFVKNIQNIDY